jgi:hypothetical protein
VGFIKEKVDHRSDSASTHRSEETTTSAKGGRIVEEQKRRNSSDYQKIFRDYPLVSPQQQKQDRQEKYLDEISIILIKQYYNKL